MSKQPREFNLKCPSRKKQIANAFTRRAILTHIISPQRLLNLITSGHGTRTVSALIAGLNDNMWHSVLLEITPQLFILEVDDVPMQQPLSEADFDFSGEQEFWTQHLCCYEILEKGLMKSRVEKISTKISEANMRQFS